MFLGIGSQLQSSCRPVRRKLARRRVPARRLGCPRRRADDDQLADHGRRRGDLIVTAFNNSDIARQIDLAFVAEIGDGPAGRGVKRDQAAYSVADEDSAGDSLLSSGPGHAETPREVISK